MSSIWIRWARFRKRRLTRNAQIEMTASGLPSTFVPGRNLIFFSFAGAVAYRRGIKHLVAGMCETDYSGYPDCRDDTIKAMQLALGLGMDRRFVLHTPLMWIDKAATFELADRIGGSKLGDLVIEETHSCYLGDRTHRHDWGYGCGKLSGLRLAGQGLCQIQGGSGEMIRIALLGAILLAAFGFAQAQSLKLSAEDSARDSELHQRPKSRATKARSAASVLSPIRALIARRGNQRMGSRSAISASIWCGTIF